MLRIVVREFRKLGDQIDRQIVHRIKAEILQRLKNRAFPGSTEACDHYHFRLSRRLR